MHEITLTRFRTEQRHVAEAEAERRAAEGQAARQRALGEDPRPTGP